MGDQILGVLPDHVDCEGLESGWPALSFGIMDASRSLEGTTLRGKL